MRHQDAIFADFCLEADKIAALVYTLGDSDPAHHEIEEQQAQELKEIREKLEQHLKDRIPDLEMFYDEVLEAY
ncbi:hypothetical protein GZ77_03965 [Endozoicomonas montiporae]|uniref:Uncharacterized protein n=2 Tax=Endozoicomonas montiporae TaxID=1027273 RepID=A0A081NBA0_9GAMM|nr:hypothetical protein [Endozoicomonas montiporae]AMO56001.1 hypothetical protein EZMO1_1858 [Endozoicomonas montiporae CL-33]KEQ15723.1 hypothetical protein GZ77_03965 [Endozoicomonas montiporae]